MKKFLSIFAIALMALVSLTACGGSDDDPAPAPTPMLESSNAILLYHTGSKNYTLKSGTINKDGHTYIFEFVTIANKDIAELSPSNVSGGASTARIDGKGTNPYTDIKGTVSRTGTTFTSQITVEIEGQKYLLNLSGTYSYDSM